MDAYLYPRRGWSSQGHREAVRVLRPGGQLLIADIRAAGEYRDISQQIGLADVAAHPLEWRFWYGGARVWTARF